jgi:Fur family ferric uptake transcriptional regulator
MGKIEEWLNCLKDNGYRITTPRRVVIDTIARSPRVLTPFDLFERARQVYPKLGLVTVYRTLEKLEELDLVQRVHRPSGCQAFVAAFSGHQHLLICQQCGRVEFFSGDWERMGALIDIVEQESGYHITEHWLQFFGLCKLCNNKPRSPSMAA